MPFTASQLAPSACICGVKGWHICTTRSQSTQCHPHVRMNNVPLSKKTFNTFLFNWNSSDVTCGIAQYKIVVLIESVAGRLLEGHHCFTINKFSLVSLFLNRFGKRIRHFWDLYFCLIFGWVLFFPPAPENPSSLLRNTGDSVFIFGSSI